MAHAAPFAFEPGAIRYADGIMRYLHGSPQIACFYAAEAGYDLILEIGVENIRRKSLRQTRLLMDAAAERGYPSRNPADDRERGGTVILDVPDGAQVTRELLRRDVLVDHRPGAGIRISPHYYTRDDELLHALDEIRSIVAARAR
jgi:kynureninase